MPPPGIPDWLYPSVVLRNQNDAFVWVQGCYCTGSGELQYETLDAVVMLTGSTTVVRVTSRSRVRSAHVLTEMFEPLYVNGQPLYVDDPVRAPADPDETHHNMEPSPWVAETTPSLQGRLERNREILAASRVPVELSLDFYSPDDPEPESESPAGFTRRPLVGFTRLRNTDLGFDPPSPSVGSDAMTSLANVAIGYPARTTTDPGYGIIAPQSVEQAREIFDLHERGQVSTALLASLFEVDIEDRWPPPQEGTDVGLEPISSRVIQDAIGEGHIRLVSPPRPSPLGGLAVVIQQDGPSPAVALNRSDIGLLALVLEHDATLGVRVLPDVPGEVEADPFGYLAVQRQNERDALRPGTVVVSRRNPSVIVGTVLSAPTAEDTIRVLLVPDGFLGVQEFEGNFTIRGLLEVAMPASNGLIPHPDEAPRTAARTLRSRGEPPKPPRTSFERLLDDDDV